MDLKSFQCLSPNTGLIKQYVRTQKINGSAIYNSSSRAYASMSNEQSWYAILTPSNLGLNNLNLGSHAEQSNGCFNNKTELLIPITFQCIRPHFYKYQMPY